MCFAFAKRQGCTGGSNSSHFIVVSIQWPEQLPAPADLTSFPFPRILLWVLCKHLEGIPGILLQFFHWWTPLAQSRGVRSCVSHYWQNGGTALNPLPLFRRHGAGMKELGFVILTCFFLSSAKLTEENIKVLIVFERSVRRHKAFCSCAQRIIHKVNHWHLFKDFYKRVFQGEYRGCSLRPWEGLLSEAYLWGKCLWQRSLLNLGLRNN